MVAQRNSSVHMRSSVTREKTNALPSLRLRHKEEAYMKKLESGLSIFRNKIQLRVDRCQEVLKRLDEDSNQMKICFLQLMDMIESSRKLISDEKEENLHILQLLDCYCDKTTVSSRTQTVAPMIYGIPLKKASISLKRLDPFQDRHVSTVIADSSPASAVGFARTAARSSLCPSINPLVVTIQSSSSSVSSSSSSSDDDDDNDDASSKTPLLRRHRRCRTWNNVDNVVSSTSGQEFRLKTASILLKRLDPRSYLPETGTSDSADRNMALQRNEIENDVFETFYRAAVQLNSVNENATEILSDENEQSQVSCPPASQDPMVVLERLVPSAWHCELDSHDNDLDLHIVHENCQSKYKLNNVCETKGKSKMKCENMKTMLQELPTDSTSTPKKRKSESVMCNVPEKRRVNCRIKNGKRTEKEDSLKVKRRPETNRKQKGGPVAVGASNKADEDPLEGPSWLYKDGVKKEKLRKFRRIRQGYLTPLYYLAPTIYSSTDDSGDEATESERKRTKLRKKKQRKRN